ncbi:UNKNOWN [Stylonychia lemnae]|uniref:Uncharacterized protein n=1 Tax=Stylonychia lemnae TaxID=5949 RepID=A0A078ACA7_STYLE|nr:UNKNOWN [Stylonychia lemnae]|eukprot:CDW78448.1 UNKNOWN [Stylonychia lemnae]
MDIDRNRKTLKIAPNKQIGTANHKFSLGDAAMINEDQAQELIKADEEIDATFLNLVNRIQFYNQKSEDLIESIFELEEQARKAKNPNQYLLSRINSQKKQKQLIDRQIQNLELYMSEMISGSAKFKEQRDQLLGNYFKNKASQSNQDFPSDMITPQPQNNDDEEQEEKEEIQQQLEEIDQKLKEIEEFMNRDYGIDEECLLMYEPLFDQYDLEIVNAPLIEYTQNDLPSYYPENGIWFNNEDVSMNRQTQGGSEPTAQELEELEKLEQEDFDKKRRDRKGTTTDKKNPVTSSVGQKFLNLFKKK